MEWVRARATGTVQTLLGIRDCLIRAPSGSYGALWMMDDGKWPAPLIWVMVGLWLNYSLGIGSSEERSVRAVCVVVLCCVVCIKQSWLSGWKQEEKVYRSRCMIYIY